MVHYMSEHSNQLGKLISALPVTNSYKSVSELNLILSKYIKILDCVNSYNPEYKGMTRVYYSDITNIRDNIQQLLFAGSNQEKDKAFENVTNELKTDLQALAMLIKPQEEFTV